MSEPRKIDTRAGSFFVWILCLGGVFVGAGLVFGVLPLFTRTSCVVEGTPIDTPGGPRAIETLEVGDEVWTMGPGGARRTGQIRAIHPARADGHLEISVSGGFVLSVTPPHPVATSVGWTPASQLAPGDEVRTEEGLRAVTSVRDVSASVRVYDLEVEPNPNFYAGGVLVHNKSTNQRNASATLKTLATAQADFRSNDRDEDGESAYWVADVRGLYSIRAANGEAIKLIERYTAGADSAPQVNAGNTVYVDLPHDDGVPEGIESSPKANYWYKVLKYYVDDRGRKQRYDQGNGRSRLNFGFLAFPDDYGPYGDVSFIINEANTMYVKDLKGKSVDTFPADPLGAGWKKMD